MNKPDVVEAVAEKAGLSKADSLRALDAFMTVVAEQLLKGEMIRLTGFGQFVALRRPPRLVRNPLTGEVKAKAASIVPRFRPGDSLRRFLNERLHPRTSRDG